MDLKNEIINWIKQRPKRVKSFYTNTIMKQLNIEYTEENDRKVKNILWELSLTKNPLITIGYHFSCDNCCYHDVFEGLNDIPDICPNCGNEVNLETIWIEYIINK